MKTWPGSPGAVTTLSGDDNGGCVESIPDPLARTSIPTLGPKLVIGAKRVSSYGFHGGCAIDGLAVAMMHVRTSNAEDSARTVIVSLLARRCTARRSGTARIGSRRWSDRR